MVALAEIGYFFGVGGDDDAIQLGACDGGFEDPGEHGAASNGAKDFAGEAGGGEACGNDAEYGGWALFARCGIKYDRNWLCRGDVSHSKRILCRRNPFTHRRRSSDG